MKKVTLALNALDPETWTTYEVSDVRDFLVQQFKEWPSTARIYNERVSIATDVTPSCEADVERLAELEGNFYVVVYPADPISIIVAVVAVAVVAAIVFAPSIPTPALRNTQNQSPNNELSERTNKPRPMARIPDIFGTIRSTPDLIAVPYKIFENNEEVEYAYMCIGRGHYEVPILEVRDDTTRAIDIAGTSVEIYAPMTSPNSGHAPQLRIGDAINTPILNAVRYNSVNGQVLRPPNDQYLRGNKNIRFNSPNEIETSKFDFTDKFAAGDTLYITGASEYTSYVTETQYIAAFSAGYFRFAIESSILPPLYQAGKECVLSGAFFIEQNEEGHVLRSYDLSGVYEISTVTLESQVVTPEFGIPYTQFYCRVDLVSPATVNPKWSSAIGLVTDAAIRVPDGSEIYNLSGTYIVLGVSDTIMTLSNPAAVNPAWETISSTPYLSPTLSTTGPKWIGPFVLDKIDLTQVFANFVAMQGLFKDDGENQYRMNVVCEIELTPINADGSSSGPAETFQATIEGSSTYRSTRATTLKAEPTFTGRCSVRARRITPTDLTFEGSVVDEIKWRDVYSISPVSETHFGNVTTVQAVTYATSGALALKERKLNMLVTRKIPIRISGSTFTTTLHATNDAAEIISAICLDPYIGNRQTAEIDFDAIYNAINEVKTYFGHNKAAEFCYTFDSKNLSFEETVKAVADAVFCTAYRRGNIIKLSFEQETDDSTLLFNHRNKVPGSETRTVRFGNQDNFDGVSFEYIDPEDDAQVTYYIPENMSAINPKEFESLGIRNKLQAHFHAWRIWNKIQYQNVTVEFTATQEADLLVRNDRILVADNTRPGIQDGEVLSQDILQLTLSQNVDLTKYAEYAIFLQLSDGTLESIPVTAGLTPRQVVLARAPRLPLAVDDELYARTTFLLVGVSDQQENAFLVGEKTSQSNFTSIVRAANYDSRYYANDKDFIDGSIDENGNTI